MSIDFHRHRRFTACASALRCLPQLHLGPLRKTNLTHILPPAVGFLDPLGRWPAADCIVHGILATGIHFFLASPPEQYRSGARGHAGIAGQCTTGLHVAAGTAGAVAFVLGAAKYPLDPEAIAIPMAPTNGRQLLSMNFIGRPP